MPHKPTSSIFPSKARSYRLATQILLLAMVVLLSTTTALAASTNSGREVRIGLLAHGIGPLSAGVESGIDLNMELLLARNHERHPLFGRAALGFSLNNRGGTNQLYVGRTWQSELPFALAFEYHFGVSIHDGHLHDHVKDRRQMGSRVIFRQSFELGYHSANFRLSVIYAHASHLGLLANRNQGLDNLGMRLSVPF